MPLKEKLISVLMPCYNAGEFIEEAIQSVLVQTFSEFELLIVDDGSVDNTREIVSNIKDERIVLISQPRKGIAAALNKGLSVASAAYIARFDADDICMPNRLEQQYAFMSANPDYIVCGGSAEYIDQFGDYVFTHTPPAFSAETIASLSYKICPFIHASVMYKKEPVAAVGYNEHAHSFEDHLLWLQLRKQGHMYNMREQLLRVRLNPGSVTMDEKKRPAAFHEIKNKALMNKSISAAEGERLLQIIQQQNATAAKEGAYFSLLAKKFLWNNYNPGKARQYVRRAIALNDFDVKDYCLLMASYLPKPVINNLYNFLNRQND